MSNYIYVNGELYHHGVKGMKWGVRKAKKEAKEAYKKEVSRINNETTKKFDSWNKKMNDATGKNLMDPNWRKQMDDENKAINEQHISNLKKAKSDYKLAKQKIDDELRRDPEFQKKQRVGREVTNGLLTTGGMAALTIFGVVKPDDGVAGAINGLVGGAATLALGANAISRILVAKLSK